MKYRKEDLALAIEGKEDWRNELSQEYPWDAVRNLDAARALTKLAGNIRQMDDDEFDELYARPIAALPDEVLHRLGEVESFELDSIWFSTTDPRELMRGVLDALDQ